MEMTLDEALDMIKKPMRTEDQLRKLEIATRRGGMIAATEEAYEIARECIKRCRDFDALRAEVGGKIYFASFDDSFPEESDVTEYEIYDMSAAGLVRVRIDDNGNAYDWVNPADPDERMFWTREEAEKKLEDLKREAAG